MVSKIPPLALITVWVDSGTVFTTEIGRHLDLCNALRGFVQLARVAGLPDGVWLHTLRQTAAPTLIEAGAHMRAVQDVLGHEDYRTTARIYSHVGEPQLRGAADKLGAAFDW